jgi:hypothetical protein
MASAIDATKPVAGSPTTASVRANFATAASEITALQATATVLAPIASPTFTGDPKAPTPTAGDADTSIATTAFVQSAIPAPGHLPGTQTNDNAAAGQVGEYLISTVAAVSLVATTFQNLTSLTLTAGDWDVEGSVTFSSAIGLNTAYAAVSNVSAGASTLPTGMTQFSQAPASAIMTTMIVPTGMARLSIAATTVVFLVAFFAGNPTTGAGSIRARRAR